MLALIDNTERRQRSMAVAFLQELPGATQEQYDQVVETLRGQTAEGRIFHVAGPIEGGWRIVDVWESQEAVNKFFQEYDLLSLKTVNSIATVGPGKGAWFKDSEGNLLSLVQFD